ncbi:MAG: nucleotide exchange factor GrpE [Pleurocapsa sp.]
MIDEQKQQEITPENLESSDRDSEQPNLETVEATDNNNQVDVNESTSISSEEGEEPGNSDIKAENEDIFTAFQQENANLKKLLDEKTQQWEQAKSQYARLAADFENFRRRTTKEKENLEHQAKKNIITELLPVIDNFERARSQIKPETEGEMTIHGSYQGVYKTLVGCLKRMGVSAMSPEGEQFDPNFHEAMLREATDEHPEGTVLEQLMRGYMLEDTVLRHAMVKVAVPKEPVITSEEKTEETEEIDDGES